MGSRGLGCFSYSWPKSTSTPEPSYFSEVPPLSILPAPAHKAESDRWKCSGLCPDRKRSADHSCSAGDTQPHPARLTAHHWASPQSLPKSWQPSPLLKELRRESPSLPESAQELLNKHGGDFSFMPTSTRHLLFCLRAPGGLWLFTWNGSQGSLNTYHQGGWKCRGPDSASQACPMQSHFLPSSDPDPVLPPQLLPQAQRFCRGPGSHG